MIEAPAEEPRVLHGPGGVRAQDVVRTFLTRRGEVQALSGMSLRADTGEIVTVVGPSGCGKTTLLELICGLQAPQSGVGDDPDAALVAVAVGHERSTFAVSDGRVCEFTRVLEWGGAALNVALARALDAAPSEVESVKRALSLMDEMTPEGLTPDQAVKARDAIRRSIQIFARELVSSLQFYQNQPGSLGIGEIVLTGGTTHLPGLAVELEKLIGVRVRVGDPLARIKMSKKLGQPEQIGSLAVAIGLGIED